ncbi:hypothetical protein FISHEDRAFT_58486 [Fistulina hepatica ATCC 64428]|uniref:Ribosomal RNA methyltransferase FtsJ domain-containing protein n=1 Tax=Fistulina hepatica ATCC 64428 TaxID=1128425 RepID=A0A0D7ADS9_9AGAR|nr:hypothetical protein FISHEDRAFT_58486 [Fistulina hepatica ATCC 64428]
MALRINEHDSDIESKFQRYLISRGASSLERLNVIRDKVSITPTFDRIFQSTKKQIATESTHVTDRLKDMFHRKKVVMDELDAHTRRIFVKGLISPSGPFCFLDLGCLPGGFALSIKLKNRSATGMGISLSPDCGGNPSLLYTSPRFSLCYANVNDVPDELTNRNCQLPYDRRAYDLVIADVQFLDINMIQSDGGRDQKTIHQRRLVLSQLAIALSAVCSGGTLLVKLSHAEDVVTAQLLHMLDSLSVSFTTYKPRAIYQHRAPFYAIAQGIKDDVRQKFLPHLHSLRCQLLEKRDRPLHHTDLDFAITYDELLEEHNLTKYLAWATPVWEAQAKALEAKLIRWRAN